MFFVIGKKKLNLNNSHLLYVFRYIWYIYDTWDLISFIGLIEVY